MSDVEARALNPGQIAFAQFATTADQNGDLLPGYYLNNTWFPVGVYRDPLEMVATTAQGLTATADINTYASLSTPLAGDVVVPDTAYSWLCLLLLAAYIDTATNNIEVALALDISGASTVPAGSRPEARLHVLGKQPVGVALSDQAPAVINPGTTHFELKHAGGACTVSDVAFNIIPLTAIA